MARYVVLGDGGHARMIAETVMTGLDEIRFTRDDDDVKDGETVIIGISDAKKRKRLFERYGDRVERNGIQRAPSVWVDLSATIGANVLINVGAQIHHECAIGAHCVIGPGVILCGRVNLGEGCEIGAGSTIVQGVALNDWTRVPAGTLVVGQNDMRRPVRPLRSRKVEDSQRQTGSS